MVKLATIAALIAITASAQAAVELPADAPVWCQAAVDSGHLTDSVIAQCFNDSSAGFDTDPNDNND